jgi:predicted CxxxxCH...CXXCH cytochrome family protein
MMRGDKIEMKEVMRDMRGILKSTTRNPQLAICDLIKIILIAALTLIVSAGMITEAEAILLSSGEYTQTSTGDVMRTSVAGTDTPSSTFTIGDIIRFEFETTLNETFQLKVKSSDNATTYLNNVTMTQSGPVGGVYTYTYDWDSSGASADFLQIEIRSTTINKAGGFIVLGSPTVGMRFYCDASYSTQTDEFADGDVVYVELDLSGTETTVRKSEINIWYNDKLDNTASSTVDQTGTTFRYHFTADFSNSGGGWQNGGNMPNGDWGFIKWQGNTVSDRMQRTIYRNDSATCVTDTTPPTPGTVTVSPDANGYTSSSPTISTQFTDNESVVTSCEYTTDGSTWSAGSLSGTSPTWTCTANPTGLSGALTINMRATSSGGTGTGTAINRTVDSTAPTDGTLTATGGDTQVSLSWTAATDGESGLATTNTYRLVYDTAGTPADCNAGTQIYQGTATSYTHTGLTNGTTYYYRVCATDAVGNESAGATASATPQACSDSDLATLTITQPTSSSTVSGTYTVQVQVGTETAPDTMTNMAVTIAGSSACDVTGAAMTWNAGTSRWEYSWDTSTCGTATPETGITIDASGNDPDCGDLVNATQVTNITIDNTGPRYTITQCTDCHQMPPTDATGGRGTPAGAVVGSHSVAEHLATTCTNCHVDNGTNLAHREGLIEFITNIHAQTGAFYDKDGDSTQTAADLSFSQTSTPTLGSCKNTYCHGTSSPTWGTDLSGTSQCYRCHGDEANPNNAPPVDTAGDTAATDPEVGAHQAHLQSTDNYSSDIACNECHTVPTNVGDAGHIDDALPADITFGNIADGGDDGQANASPSYNYNTGTCSNVYCHDETYFKNGWGSGTDPTWNDTTYIQGNSGDCNNCHGYPPGGGHPADNNCTGCHSHVNGTNDGFTDATLHVNGTVEGGGDCISCHSSQQGTARRNVSPDFAKTSHHVSTGMPTDQLTCQACHGDLPTDQGHPGTATADPQTELQNADTGTYVTVDPSTSSATLTTFCLSCHDSNGASRLGANANKPFTDSGDNTAPPDINSAWTNTYNHSANAECNDCHGDNSAAGTTLDPKYNMHGSANNTILRESTEYDTCVTSGCHGSGGSATTDMTVELSGTGGKHPIGSAVTPNSTILQADTTGDLFVNGWTKGSVAQCSDCHGMNQAGSINVGPRGPHGSAYQYMLRGVDTSITGATSGRAYGTPTNADATVNPPYTEQTYCINCHASDVYGVGTGDYVPTNNGLSGIAHYSTFRSDRCGNPDGSTVAGKTQVGSTQPIGCTNCHAGAGWNYGAHSSTGPLGKNNAGFMNGNSWDNSTSPGTACYTGSGGAGGWNTCNKGDHGGY